MRISVSAALARSKEWCRSEIKAVVIAKGVDASILAIVVLFLVSFEGEVRWGDIYSA